MIELLSGSIIDPAGIETLNMLPGIASLAINRVPVVVREVANTLDGVRLFVCGLDNGKRIVRRDRRSRIEGDLRRSRDLRCDR
jgi:hypothetical protein